MLVLWKDYLQFFLFVRQLPLKVRLLVWVEVQADLDVLATRRARVWGWPGSRHGLRQAHCWTGTVERISHHPRGAQLLVEISFAICSGVVLGFIHRLDIPCSSTPILGLFVQVDYRRTVSVSCEFSVALSQRELTSVDNFRWFISKSIRNLNNGRNKIENCIKNWSHPYECF